MSTTAKKTSARDKARAKMAEQREAQRAREQATEKDLATLLSADDVIAKAREQQQAAIDKAQSVYDKACAAAQNLFELATVTARADQAAAAYAMKQRGDTIATIADLSEMSTRDITALIKSHNDSTAQTGTPANSSEDGQRHERDDTGNAGQESGEANTGTAAGQPLGASADTDEVSPEFAGTGAPSA